MRTSLFVTSLLLGACAATPVQVVGPYASQLSDADVQQVKLVVSQRQYIDHRVAKITAVRRDKLLVRSGHPETKKGVQKYTTFTLYRTDGKWRIDDASIRWGTSGITITVN